MPQLGIFMHLIGVAQVLLKNNVLLCQELPSWWKEGKKMTPTTIGINKQDGFSLYCLLDSLSSGASDAHMWERVLAVVEERALWPANLRAACDNSFWNELGKHNWHFEENMMLLQHRKLSARVTHLNDQKSWAAKGALGRHFVPVAEL